MKIAQRITAPTPVFFKKLRNIGLTVLAVSAAILEAPVALPLMVVKLAGYLAVAGGVMSAVSQTAVHTEK